MAIDAVINRDLPLIQGLVLTFAVLFILINLLIDMTYACPEPEAAPWLIALALPAPHSGLAAGPGEPPGPVGRRIPDPAARLSPSRRRCSRPTIRSTRTCSTTSCRRSGIRAPRPTFLLGTDSLGRDTLSRLMYGARVALIVAVVAAFAAGRAWNRPRPARRLFRRRGRHRDFSSGRHLDGLSLRSFCRSSWSP